MSKLQEVDASINFAREEEKTLSYWKEIDAFNTSLKKSEGKKPFSFYDGPPFATGYLPHYGHILAGTIKDVVTRYAHQTGHYVERRFGWDCHGLPIEFEIEKILKRDKIFEEKLFRADIEEYGIARYNDKCESIVMKYSSEWEQIITRLGRWIDFKNDYKTMNFSFMESVWWVFKQLWDKNLVYKGVRVMPYSTGCTTPLSNFEVTQGYRDVQDTAITVAFPIKSEDEKFKDTSFLVWTTTPWTLPSNLALCVNPEFTYVRVYDEQKKWYFIVLKDLASKYFKKVKTEGEFKGSDLVGMKYEPLYNFYAEEFADAFRVISDDYVTNSSGTGIVHQAPGFGEDDNRVCAKFGIIDNKTRLPPCPLDDIGRYVSPIETFKGMYIKDADPLIIEDLRSRLRLFKKEGITHKYPFCWRSDTPLIYKTVPSWFVRVTDLRDRLLENNKQTYWVPEHVQEGRFHNWLADCKDWTISRSRYWGTPIPVWMSEDGEEMVAVGSVAELEQLTGITGINNLHRQHIDKLTIPSQKVPGKVLKRVSDVFDCWFESGSMPYAQNHYPFENPEKFQDSFPADFIAEGLDQTRGWFYTLLVLGTALFDKCPFQNVIVNGLVLAEDGSKMSKSKKNYPDPQIVIDKHGSDALRLYLINSPVVRAEPLKFKEDGVFDVVKEILLQWYNAYRFFVQSVKRYVDETGEDFNSDIANAAKIDNIMDKWIISSSNSLLKNISAEMKAYRLYNVTPKLEGFIDHLTRWYVKINNKRLKGEQKDQTKEDRLSALSAMFIALYNVVRIMAPFTPFLTEKMYQNLKNLLTKSEDSVHYEMLPECDESKIDLEIERTVEAMQAVIKVGRTLRVRKNIPSRTPVSSYIVCNIDEDFIRRVKSMEYFIKKELNIHGSVIATSNIQEYSVKLEATPNNKALGVRLGKKFKDVYKAITGLKHEELVSFLMKKEIVLCGETINNEDLIVANKFVGTEKNYFADECGTGTLILNTDLSEELKELGFVREAGSKVQQMRKEARLKFEDKVDVFLTGKSSQTVVEVLKKHSATLAQHLKGMDVFFEAVPSGKDLIIQQEMNVDRLTQEESNVVVFTLIRKE
ncbi:isoleucyl-tRNA synthetase [Naegleria gruberi]|uniref:isoleucine--tRNA ligase n=1 Tax=Naegleria gruberi TaxID=5762 RepID=D2V782_NAEGR|nr:isoleucyl-tRNA synthetase [Naegleria gruberi]EFC47212.1 isoleucyl-tRNA synthetase [Naegleria gruberi]|eukprot:XP_002679956.1 isoleucyl-tRNA synthetase [Naegleria gruberi strain NEG-M]